MAGKLCTCLGDRGQPEAEGKGRASLKQDGPPSSRPTHQATPKPPSPQPRVKSGPLGATADSPPSRAVARANSTSAAGGGDQHSRTHQGRRRSRKPNAHDFRPHQESARLSERATELDAQLSLGQGGHGQAAGTERRAARPRPLEFPSAAWSRHRRIRLLPCLAGASRAARSIRTRS